MPPRIHHAPAMAALAAAVLAPAPAPRAETSMSYQTFRRLNEPRRMVKSQDRLRLHTDRTYFFDTSSAVTDASFELYPDDRSVNWSVGEAYYFFTHYDLDFSAGRKILEWNPNEKFWGGDVLNSRRNFTLLDLKREGLLGLHLSSWVGRLRYDAFFSYLHVPTMNPRIDVEDGSVVSRNEWVALPPTRTTINGISRPIRYELVRPGLRDAVLKKSFGMRTAWHWRPDGRHPGNAAIYGMYKPENSLSFNAEAFYDGGRREVVVVAHPIVNHHVVLGANVTQGVRGLGNAWSTTLGVEYVDPNAKIGRDFDAIDPIGAREANRNFESEFFVLKPAYRSRTHAQGSVSYSGETGLYSLNYLRLLSEPLAGDDFYSPVDRWREAVGVGLKANLDRRFDVELDVKYDLEREDVLAVAELGYIAEGGFLMGLGAELLVSPENGSFWAPYRTNDSLYLRLAHLF